MLDARGIHALVKAEDWPRAWFAVNAALNEEPDRPELLYLAGCVLRAQGHVALAIPIFSRALAQEQRQPNVWMHYGACLHDVNEWDDAIKAFQVVARMLPTDPMPPANIAASYTQKGQWNNAIKWGEKALSLDPDNYIAHISLSYACLALGRWSEGWKHGHHQYGTHIVVRVYNDKDNEEPTWDGTKGKRVVVQCDQGLGDIIMYGQCLRQMVDDCEEVILECADRLVPLMRRNFPRCKVFGTLKQAAQSWSVGMKIDAHIHISDLPRFYRNADSDFERVPYITPDSSKVEKWKTFLSRFPRPWVGVSWKGGIQQTQKHVRSLSLEQLAPVLEQEGTHFDLSYKDNSKEVNAWNARLGSHVVIPPIDQDDYDDTVALLSCLDEVVTVTTALVHACGALGRTARVLVPEVPMWRYAHRCGDGMIWYPPDSVRMYRRKSGEEWSSTIRRLADDIRPRVVVAA